MVRVHLSPPVLLKREERQSPALGKTIIENRIKRKNRNETDSCITKDFFIERLIEGLSEKVGNYNGADRQQCLAEPKKQCKRKSLTHPKTIICDSSGKRKQVCEENTNGAVQAKKSIR